MNLILRIISYTLIYIAYLVFMDAYAPMGTGWLEYHSQRIFNAVEFLKINGYLEFYGFTIWDTCRDCSLDFSNWQESIYFSSHSINLLPYIILNHFGGRESLVFLGPIYDKMMIFSCAVVISELFLKSAASHTSLPKYIIGISFFCIFVFSPWTYQMMLAQWFEVPFLLFFMIGMLAFLYNKTIYGYLAFFSAGLLHYQWAFLLSAIYFLLIFAKFIFVQNSNIAKYFPPNHESKYHRINITLILILPVCIFILLRVYAQQYIGVGSGSSLFSRIGISGNDIHNGGLIGAMQFLAGARFTQCFQGLGMGVFSGNLENIIAFYNCMLSLAGMAILSVISFIGAYFLILRSHLAKKIFLPLLFALVCMIAFLQQSLSVHLMGYSFIFSALFSAGILMAIFLLQNKFLSNVLALISCIPLISGILISSIRVSMLSGMG